MIALPMGGSPKRSLGMAFLPHPHPDKRNRDEAATLLLSNHEFT
jgi:hypothetical protein